MLVRGKNSHHKRYLCRCKLLSRFVTVGEDNSWQKTCARKLCRRLAAHWFNSNAFELLRNYQNILMIGPTGVGKTEIARRLAKLVSAPFIKVEATKFTEVGFHGRDVDQIIRDLVDAVS